ncbi:MAG: hypothetical protein A3K66_04830 [Euryarchaeota archaeon RBG_16_67_27]|nr:MAG: hypothetical protein A3K66_04830 [Euryarchaeota archaeon RBG_16_67_27]
MRISRWALLWFLTVGVLVVIELGILTNVITPGNLIGFFVAFVFALVVISVLAIVGAVFVGMFVSHRILSTQGFTPFEQEMLRMRQEVRDIKERLDEIAARVNADPKRKP